MSEVPVAPSLELAALRTPCPSTPAGFFSISGQMSRSASMSAPCATFARHHTLACASELAPMSHVSVNTPAWLHPHALGSTSAAKGAAMPARNASLSASGISLLALTTSPVARETQGSVRSQGESRWRYATSAPPYMRCPPSVTEEHTHGRSSDANTLAQDRSKGEDAGDDGFEGTTPGEEDDPGGGGSDETVSWKNRSVVPERLLPSEDAGRIRTKDSPASGVSRKIAEYAATARGGGLRPAIPQHPTSDARGSAQMIASPSLVTPRFARSHASRPAPWPWIHHSAASTSCIEPKTPRTRAWPRDLASPRRSSVATVAAMNALVATLTSRDQHARGLAGAPRRRRDRRGGRGGVSARRAPASARPRRAEGTRARPERDRARGGRRARDARATEGARSGGRARASAGTRASGVAGIGGGGRRARVRTRRGSGGASCSLPREKKTPLGPV